MIICLFGLNHLINEYPNFKAVNPTDSYWAGEFGTKFIVSRIPLSILIKAFLYGVCTCIIGTASIAALCKSLPGIIHRFGLVSTSLACYPFGILIVIAINRTLTLIFDNSFAQLASMLAVISISGYILASNLKTKGNVDLLKTEGSISILSIGPWVLFALILVGQIHYPNAHIVGDGAKFTFDIIMNDSFFGQHGQVPIILKHYDELLYNYPLIVNGQHDFNEAQLINNTLITLWINYSFAKTACILLLAIIGRLLGLSLFDSLLITAFCFLGTPHLTPYENRLIFDSGGPLYICLHPGRVIVVALSILAASTINIQGYMQRLSPSLVLILTAFGVGLSSFSISSFAIILMLFIASVFKPKAVDERLLYVVALLSITCYILYFIRIQGQLSTIAEYLSLNALVLCMILSASKFIKGRSMSGSYPLFSGLNAPILIITTGFLTGLLFLGNSFAMHFLQSANSNQVVASGVGSAIFGVGLNPFCGRFPHNLYCSDGWEFLKSYGLPGTLMTLLVLIKYVFKRSFRLVDYIIISISLLLTLSLWVFLFTNKMAVSDIDLYTVWYKSRIVEPFFYALLFFSLFKILTYKRPPLATCYQFALFACLEKHMQSLKFILRAYLSMNIMVFALLIKLPLIELLNARFIVQKLVL